MRERLSKSAILKTITNLREMTQEPGIKIIIDQDNWDYFKHRAIEAIHAQDYWLACKLLVILITRLEKDQK